MFLAMLHDDWNQSGAYFDDVSSLKAEDQIYSIRTFFLPCPIFFPYL